MYHILISWPEVMKWTGQTFAKCVVAHLCFFWGLGINLKLKRYYIYIQQTQWLFYKHLCHYLIHSLIE